MNAERRETPVIIIPDSVTEDDPNTFKGYTGEDAGGHRMTFGRHKGYVLNDIPEDYMVYVKREFKTAGSRRMPVVTAVEKYTAWLLEYAKDNYKEFIVPCGKQHFGQKIAQCRDRKWFRWILKQPILRRKFPIFCAAVREHLKNPIHQEVPRDIGELLSATRDADDRDLLNPTQYEKDMEFAVFNKKEREELAGNIWIAVSDDDGGSISDDGSVSGEEGEDEDEDLEDPQASTFDSHAYDKDFIDDADVDLDDDNTDIDNETYFNWPPNNITQSGVRANLGSTYRVGRAGTFANWQPNLSTTDDATPDADFTDPDTELAAIEDGSVGETDSVRESTPAPASRHKTRSKRKRVTSDEDNIGIEDDDDSQFDNRSYAPSQELFGRLCAISPEKVITDTRTAGEDNVEISQRKTRSIAKAVAKLASPLSKRTPRRRAQDISSSSSDDMKQAHLRRLNTSRSTLRAKGKRNIVSPSGSDSLSEGPSPKPPKRETKRFRGKNALNTDNRLTSSTNTRMGDKTAANYQSSSETEEASPRRPLGSAKMRADFRVTSPSSGNSSPAPREESIDVDERQPRSSWNIKFVAVH